MTYEEIKAERDAYLASQGQTAPDYNFDLTDEEGNPELPVFRLTGDQA